MEYPVCVKILAGRVFYFTHKCQNFYTPHSETNGKACAKPSARRVGEGMWTKNKCFFLVSNIFQEQPKPRESLAAGGWKKFGIRIWPAACMAFPEGRHPASAILSAKNILCH